MSMLIFYEIAGVFALVQLFVGLWVKIFPSRKITDPGKSLTARCCYHSELAAENIENWNQAQQLYWRWNLKLLLPNLASTALVVSLFVWAVHPSFSTMSAVQTFIYCLCLLVPIFWLLLVRVQTEQGLKKWVSAQPRPTKPDTEESLFGKV